MIVGRRRPDNLRTVRDNKYILDNVKCVSPCIERCEAGCNILRSPDCEWRNFEAERAGRCLNLAHL